MSLNTTSIAFSERCLQAAPSWYMSNNKEVRNSNASFSYFYCPIQYSGSYDYSNKSFSSGIRTSRCPIPF